VWIDTWRKKFRAQYPGWDYQLWTDSEVANLDMRMKVFVAMRTCLIACVGQRSSLAAQAEARGPLLSDSHVAIMS